LYLADRFGQASPTSDYPVRTSSGSQGDPGVFLKAAVVFSVDLSVDEQKMIDLSFTLKLLNLLVYS